MKQHESMQAVPSWYPTPEELLAKQREQMATSKQAAADFASHAFLPAAPWWRRIFVKR